MLASFVIASALAYAPTPVSRVAASRAAARSAVADCTMQLSRRDMLASGASAFAAAATLGSLVQPVYATDYGLTKDYQVDSVNLIANMRLATNLTRGTDGFEQTVELTRKQMNEYVSYYRRQSKYSGAQSFGTLYTAVNTLAGHYASYGNSYPVPAKRRERLTVQYKEAEKYLKKGR